MAYQKNILMLILILFISLSESGCLLAAAGAGIGAIAYGNSKNKAAQAKTMDSYNEYALGMQKINIERQEKHLEPVKVMTFKEYCNSL